MTSTFPDRRVAICDSVLDCIGQTPCVRLSAVPKMYGIECEVVAKCECFNPGGSVKDRIGKAMVEEAEATSALKAGDTIVEATSGNTGIALAMTAAVKGYKCVITMPTKMSQEKSSVVQALGATVVRTPLVPFDHPDSLISVARKMSADHGYVMPDQYRNPANTGAHYANTAQEIYEQCQGKIDMVVMGVGTGGTIHGVGKRLKELCPGVTIVGVDPIGSILADPSQPATSVSYQVEGIGYDFVPAVCDRSYVDEWVKTEDTKSFRLARELQRHEGLLVGGSCGSAMVGVLEAARRLGPHQRCVVLFPDGIRNYMSKFVDDNWMIEKGFTPGTVSRPTYGALAAENEQLQQRIAELEAAANPSA